MLEMIITLIIFLFPLAYSPGPGNMFFAVNSARFGFWATLPASIGYHITTWLITGIIGFGFLIITDQLPQFFFALKIAGSLYVLWIAWKIIKASTLKGSAQPKPATFLEGVILMLLNPKAYVIIALMFSQFLQPMTADKFTSVLLITTIFTLNNFIAFSLWSLVGDRIAYFFRTPESADKINLMFGITLAAVAIWMLLSRF